MKVLVVDDDGLMLELVSRSLSDVGFSDVTVAATAADALIAFTRGGAEYDCILLDIEMPEFDGIELCQWLRRQEKYRDTHVLMVTAKADKTHVDRAFAAGASDYLTKPFEVHQLCARVKAIESALRNRAGRKDLPGRAPFVLDHGGVDFSDPMTLPKVKAALSYNALVNYVLQLPRLHLFGSRVFAFKIGGIGRIYATSTGKEFVRLVEEVATAISSVLNHSEFFFSYAGEGAFLCVAHGRKDYDVAAIEDAVNRILSERHPAGEEGQALRVWASSQMRGGAFRSGQSVLGVLQLAVRSAVENAYAAQATIETLKLPFGSVEKHEAPSRALSGSRF